MLQAEEKGNMIKKHQNNTAQIRSLCPNPVALVA